MQSRRILIGLAVLVVGVVGWALFRPERLFVNQRVNESLAPAATASAKSAEPAVLASGDFHTVSHKTMGTATIYTLAGGKRVFRFTHFETSNGPDVQVYLVAAADANDAPTVTKAGFVTLGGLKGNIGDQNYDVPSDVDLAKYRAVTIWCRRFGANFATAPLTPQNS